MRNLVPKTIRYKMLLLTLIIVTIPILITGFIVKFQAKESLLAEKQTKLFGFARLLDEHLGDGFDSILVKKNLINADRNTKIKALNEALYEYTDIVAGVNVGIGVGYYNKELDAIITYGPSENYAGKVGLSIEGTHLGRKVMETNQSMVQFAPLVRGNVMNTMIPIQREGKNIGYIWANELTDDIQAQVTVMEKNIYLALLIGIIVSTILIMAVTDRFLKDVEGIKTGLEGLQFDLKKNIRPMNGEMGEIVEAINQMAQSLLDARSLNENIMYSIADGVVTINRKGLIMTVNQAGEKITGFSLSEIIGKPYREVFCEGNDFHSLLLDTLETGTTHIGIEMDYPVRDRWVYISTSTTMLKDSHNQSIGAVVVFKDLTQQHRLQQQVYRAERLAALGELMANIAHEIRNPLTAIKGFVQYLQNVDNEEERQEYMPVIIKEVDRVNRVIEELLHFARPCKACYSFVDINEIIKKTLILFKNKSTSQQVDFSLSLTKGLLQIEADAEQIKQVLLNLLINGMQAISEKGCVEISTWQWEETAIYVRIRDTGSGIKADDVQKVFDPFFTTKVTGTGLGLAVVQRIISDHYGNIEIDSREGEGTSVTLKLPVSHQGGRDFE